MENKNIKNKVFKIASILMLSVMMLTSSLFFTGCKKEETPPENSNPSSSSSPAKFGEFDYMGIYLYGFAKYNITASEAKTIISNTAPASAESYGYIEPSNIQTPEAKVNEILATYSSVIIKTKYYEDGKTTQQTREDLFIGSDFKTILQSNQAAPYSQLIAKNLILYPELIDHMETLNTEFKNSPEAAVAPFNDIFSYHKNSTGNLVLRTRDFAEIPASAAGGIGSSFRQDTEILYDAEHKISKWQTSLGLLTSNPSGQTKTGYILEIEFEWIKKN